MFEAADRIGGRTTTVKALDSDLYPTELGASIFVKANQILYNAAHEFNLTRESLDSMRVRESDYSLGVWDGDSFVFKAASSENNGGSWWDIAKMLWRYGLAPIRTQRLMKSTVGRFLSMYEEPVFPFTSLDWAATRVGLVDWTAQTGEQVLKKNGIGDKFAREIVQASTRVNYGQNLVGIHGLETMVCMATDGAMAIDGGNWQIFDKMVSASGSDIKLKTEIRHVQQHGDRYRLESWGEQCWNDVCIEDNRYYEDFDTVVLASPYQFSRVSFDPPLENVPDEIPYVKLHVSLFTSPHRISPGFFDMAASTSANEIPEMILTTLPEGEDLTSEDRGKRGVGPAGFWSISMLRKIDDEDGTTQYLYKVFSPEKLKARWVADLLALSPGSYDPESTDSGLAQLNKRDISWYHEKVWRPYPYELPRLTFEHIRLAGAKNGNGRGIFYTSGIESFISTMETSALMGKNVASLIVQERAAQAGQSGPLKFRDQLLERKWSLKASSSAQGKSTETHIDL